MALVTVTDFIREILSYQKLNGRFHVLKNFINEQCIHQDETTKEIAGNKLIRRDANGTAKVAAPVEADDIARKAEVDAVGERVGVIEKSFQANAFLGGTDDMVLETGAGIQIALGLFPLSLPAGKSLKLKRVNYNIFAQNTNYSANLSGRFGVGINSNNVWQSDNNKADVLLDALLFTNNDDSPTVINVALQLIFGTSGHDGVTVATYSGGVVTLSIE